VKAMVGAFRGVGKSVHLGYGLHCGWAIEGAVGSPLKIVSLNLNHIECLCVSLSHTHTHLFY
jgi:hypothetical protein